MHRVLQNIIDQPPFTTYTDTMGFAKILVPQYSRVALSALGRDLHLEGAPENQKYEAEIKTIAAQRGAGAKKPRYDRAPLHTLAHYAMSDLVVTDRLARWCLSAYNQLEKKPEKLLRNELGMPLLLFGIEQRGVQIDLDYVRSARTRCDNLAASIRAQVVEKIPAAASSDVSALLRKNTWIGEQIVARGGNLPRTPTGKYVTDAETLENCTDEFAQLVVAHRRVNKQKNTYFDAILERVDENGTTAPTFQSVLDAYWEI